MSIAVAEAQPRWADLFQAQEFVDRRLEEWAKQGLFRPEQLEAIRQYYAGRKQHWEDKRQRNEDPPGVALPEALPGETPAAKSLRYWTYLHDQIQLLTDRKLLNLAQEHDLTALVQEHQAHLARQLAPGEILDALPVNTDPEERAVRRSTPPPPRPARPAEPRKPLLEILLDPRNIQYLFVFGGLLTVIGVVILLWINDYFTKEVIAGSLGSVNLATLVGGWLLVRMTRYQTAGRALTLLACLVMPLNLWYYQANDLLTLQGHLWAGGVVVSVLYLISAFVLEDEIFVWILQTGVALTGLLILASLPPSPQKFWEVASPSTLLVLLGLLGIHLERAFPDQPGAFGRRRFGLAFFWSGHLQMLAGLFLLLGAFVSGSWLYEPLFRSVYEQNKVEPASIVAGEQRWVALVLLLLATYAYVYSDVIVRKLGLYVHAAALTLVWAFVVTLQMLNLTLTVDVLIMILAGLGLVINLVQATATSKNPYTRTLPVFAVLLPLLAVVLGVVGCFRHISPDLKSTWQGETLTWTSFLALLLTAITCRVGAYLYRNDNPTLSAVYFFATGAATLTGVTTLFTLLGLNQWEHIGPALMVVPCLYLIAARIYRGQSAEHALVWVAHVATVVMLLSSLASSFTGFSTLIEKQPLNLWLALFFGLVAVFYALAAGLHRQAVGVQLAALAACAVVWQLFIYAGMQGEIYILAFALVGLVMLIAYRFALLDAQASPSVVESMFTTANALLSLSFVSSALLGLSRLTESGQRWDYIGLCGGLLAVSLLTLTLVRHKSWRRWYVVTTIGEALLTFLGITLLSGLAPIQKLEIFCIGAGVLLLIVGHIGWYREQERNNDLVSLSLFGGSMLVCVPLTIATLVDRYQNNWIWANEVGFLVAGLALMTTGFMFQLRSTTLVGAATTTVYFVTLAIFVPWSRLNGIAIAITVGGLTLFTLGLILSVFRDRLLTLPERIKRREGVFRVLAWR